MSLTNLGDFDASLAPLHRSYQAPTGTNMSAMHIVRSIFTFSKFIFAHCIKVI